MKSKNSIEHQRKILFLAANPIGTDHLRLDEEVRDIEEGLQRSKYRDQFKVEQKWAVRLRDLRRTLFDCEPQILHFTGHGELEGILVEDKHGFASLVPPSSLIGLFKLHANRIECVILSACYSDQQARAINKHIKYVIGMPSEIKDRAALEFAVGFYDALGAGKTVDEAHQFGCNAIQQFCPEIPDFVYPQLRVNSEIQKRKRISHPHQYILLFFFLVAIIAGLKLFSLFSPSNIALNISPPVKKMTIAETATPPKYNFLPRSDTETDTYVYVTSTGKKYHRLYCTHLKRSKIRMKLSNAKEEGYTPCSVCDPPE